MYGKQCLRQAWCFLHKWAFSSKHSFNTDIRSVLSPRYLYEPEKFWDLCIYNYYLLLKLFELDEGILSTWMWMQHQEGGNSGKLWFLSTTVLLQSLYQRIKPKCYPNTPRKLIYFDWHCTIVDTLLAQIMMQTFSCFCNFIPTFTFETHIHIFSISPDP